MIHQGFRTTGACRAFVVLSVVLGAFSCRAHAAVDDVIPMPRQVQRFDGALTLNEKPLRVVVDVAEPSYPMGIEQLITDLKALDVRCAPGAADDPPRLYIGRPAAQSEFAERCRKAQALPDPNWGPEGYRLKITPVEIVLAGNGEAGCFYGLQTIRQMLDPLPGGQGAKLECVDIRDWPAMKWRGTMYSLQQPDEHRRVAFYKMNLINWEVNATPSYRTIPELAGPMPLAVIREAATSARRHFIHLILETQSFGHVGWLLDKLPSLRAMPDNNHVLRPLYEPTYELLNRIYGELCPLYDTPVYHAGCDEPWGIERWAEQQGLHTAEVIGKHLQRLADVLRKHGKRTMIWGDYLLAHREAIRWMNPKDFIVCDWHYEPVREYPSVDFFVKNGFETIVSPSVVPARPIFPDYKAQITNIRCIIQDGFKRGAIGLLNTNWPVDPMPIECYWYGWVCGAEYAWNPTGRSQEAFDKVFFRRVYGISADQAHDLFDKLARLDVMSPLEQESQAPRAKLNEYARAAMEIVAPVIPPVEIALLEGAQTALDGAKRSAGPTMSDRYKGFQEILERLRPLPDYLKTCRAVSTAIGEAAAALAAGEPDQLKRALVNVREGSADWVRRIQAWPAFQARDEAMALARGIAEATRVPDGEPEKQVRSVLDLVGLKSQPAGRIVRLKPGGFFSVCPDPAAASAPFARPEGWCHLPSQGAGVRWTFNVRRAGNYRVLALLRHSAGIWENQQFVRGGRNSAYVDRYAWKLDDLPIKERWVGQELNPDADEAFQWAELADLKLEKGEHTLRLNVTGINHAIVAEFVFTLDPQFTPETTRPDLKRTLWGP